MNRTPSPFFKTVQKINVSQCVSVENKDVRNS